MTTVARRTGSFGAVQIQSTDSGVRPAPCRKLRSAVVAFQDLIEDRDLRRAEYGDERTPEMAEVFARIDPINNAQRIMTSLMIAHGKNDPRVPFSEAEQIAPKVRTNGQTVWTAYADNEGHGFARKENRDYITAVITMFLMENLLGQKQP